MVVTDKTNDIAILRTLGMGPNGVVRVFFVQGAMIGWAGVLRSASVLGIVARNQRAGHRSIRSRHLLRLPGDAGRCLLRHPVSRPSSNGRTFRTIAISAFVLTSLGDTLYPARRAALVNPAIGIAIRVSIDGAALRNLDWQSLQCVRAASNSFVSLISAISMLGIAIAVSVLIIVLSVVNGFERELKDRLLAMTAHASIEGVEGQLEDWQDLQRTAEINDRVVAAAPYVNGQALVVFGEQLSGAELRGIDAQQEDAVSGVAGLMLEGRLDSLEPGEFNVVLGVELANKLGVALGDKVTVTLAEGIVTPAGIVPRTKRFTVSGIYRVGMYEFDRRLAFIDIGDAQKLYRKKNTVTGMRLAVTEIYQAHAIVREVALEHGALVLISDWTRRHVNFFRSIQITKSILFVILLMVIAVAAFNIVSTLVMVVKDKQADIAILRTVGARPSSILRIFVTQGSVIGIVGTFAGVLFGVLLAMNLETVVTYLEAIFGIKFLAADVYFISDLPSELRVGDVLRIAAIALALALVSTLYPAWVAARTAPAEALRYD